jgi:hypothetical protein
MERFETESDKSPNSKTKVEKKKTVIDEVNA